MKDSDIIALYMKRDEQAIRETAAVYERYCMGISMGIVDGVKKEEVYFRVVADDAS